MPVVSPSRYSSASGGALSGSLSSGSYRSTLSSASSLDRPYYNSYSGSYITPRRNNYSTERSSNSVSEYRSRLTYSDTSDVVRERKASTYSSDYSRYTRAPSSSVSDSDSGISSASRVTASTTRPDRSGSRSRDTSVARSDSARSSRSEAAPRLLSNMSSADFYNRYSPSNYTPQAQRLSTAVTGPNGERNLKLQGDAARLPPPRRAQKLLGADDEVKPRLSLRSDRSNTAIPIVSDPSRTFKNRTATNSTLVSANNTKPCANRPAECVQSSTNRLTKPVNGQADPAGNLSLDAVSTSKVTKQHGVDYVQKQKLSGRMSTSNIILTRAVTQASHSANTTPSSTWAERSRHHACPALSDDNGNDLQLSVAEIRRKFDPKMTVTRLPAHEPALYKTAHSSDNIYSQVKNLKSISSILNGDDKPVSGHKPHSIDKYMNGTTGSLRWEFLSPSPSPVDSKSADTNGYTIKHATEPGSDISTIYIAGKMNAERSPKNSVKNQLNANNAMGKILEKSTTVYVGNGDVNNPTMCNGKQEKNYDPPKNVLNIEIGNSNSIVANGVDDANLCSKKVQNHTSDFASYIQVSSSIPSSGSKYDNTDSNAIKENGLPLTNGYESQENGVKNITSSLNTEENDRHKLRFIDSEPNSESDSRLFIDKDDNYSPSVDENGFENKTFEHENLLLRNKAEDKLIDYSTKPKRLLADVEDDLQDSSEDVVDSGSSVEDPKIPETPILRRKIIDNNAETSSSYQPYQNESSGKRSTSPVAAASSSSTLSSASSRQNNSGEVLSKTSGLNGLRNIGNTCFMNSVVQCLSNTRPLMEYCGSPEAINKDINTTLSCMKGALIKAFSTVIFELWKADETDGVVNTTALKSQIQRFAPRFMGYSQQDAQEFLRYLLEGLHEDVNRVTVKPKPILTEIDDNLSDAQKAMEAWQRYLRMEDSRVGDIFVGQLKSSLRCTHCSHTSVTFDPFWDLSLSIPSRTGQMKLTQCLSHFTREEEMDGDEKPTCSKCQVRRKCLKWFTVQKFPRVLVIHLKRFSPTERFRGKLNVTVEFPLTHLDMTPYSANNVKAVYSLYAVSNHSGTTYSGHYTAYCKHPYNGEWHEYNDSRVSPIAAKSVVSSEAYVLFYELTSGPTS